jgi:hypothetical protein
MLAPSLQAHSKKQLLGRIKSYTAERNALGALRNCVPNNWQNDGCPILSRSSPSFAPTSAPFDISHTRVA